MSVGVGSHKNQSHTYVYVWCSEVAIHPGHPSAGSPLLDVRWTNTAENPARVVIVWTFHKLHCPSTVNFGVYVDGQAQSVEYIHTEFSDMSAQEFSFEHVVSSGGAIDWIFGSAGSWSCDNSALSIRVLRGESHDVRAGPCDDGQMERYETACNSGGHEVLASTHHFWMEQVTERECYDWCIEHPHCLWFQWQSRVSTVWAPGACHGRVTDCGNIDSSANCDTLASDSSLPLSAAHADPCGEATAEVVCFVKKGYTGDQCTCQNEDSSDSLLQSSSLGCYQSYGWDSTFSCDDGAEAYYYSCERLVPDPANSVVARCEESCIAAGYDHFAIEDSTACMCGRGPPTSQVVAGCAPCSDVSDFMCGAAGKMSIYAVQQAGFVLSGTGICPGHDGDYDDSSADAWLALHGNADMQWALHQGMGHRICGGGITLDQCMDFCVALGNCQAISWDEYPCCFPNAGACSGSEQFPQYDTYSYTRGTVADEWIDGDHLISVPGQESVSLYVERSQTGEYWVKVLQKQDAQTVVDPGETTLNALFQHSAGVLKYTIGSPPVVLAYYKRHEPANFDIYSYLTCCWREDQNELHTDFEMYSDEPSMMAETREWQSIAYNSDGVSRGFPGTSLFPHVVILHIVMLHIVILHIVILHIVILHIAIAYCYIVILLYCILLCCIL
eukprot:SAG31_NODE_249_length_19118_cov_47.456195_23_plen_670_part_00